MIKLSLIGAALIAITIWIHAAGTLYWMRFLVGRYTGKDGSWRESRTLLILLGSAIFLVTLHVLEILIWAVAYRQLVPDELPTLEQAAYFSFVTYTTLGYGDITLADNWRLLSGFEAINGILLAGWTTAILFAIVQRSWARQRDRLLDGSAQQ
jgi:voltage-gated potassium channel